MSDARKAAMCSVMTNMLVLKSPNATPQDKFVGVLSMAITTLMASVEENAPLPPNVAKAMALTLMNTAEDAGYFSVERADELVEWAIKGCPPRTNDALRREILDEIQDEDLRAGIEGDPALLRRQAS